MKAEPAALVCRWYSWYLLAFCRLRQDYRQFKLVQSEQPERQQVDVFMSGILCYNMLASLPRQRHITS